MSTAQLLPQAKVQTQPSTPLHSSAPQSTSQLETGERSPTTPPRRRPVDRENSVPKTPIRRRRLLLVSSGDLGKVTCGADATAASAATLDSPREASCEREGMTPSGYTPPRTLRRFASDAFCAICLEPLLGKPITILVCGHSHHTACLPSEQQRCPQCREPTGVLIEHTAPASVAPGSGDVQTERHEFLRDIVRMVILRLPVDLEPNVREVTVEALLTRAEAARREILVGRSSICVRPRSEVISATPLLEEEFRETLRRIDRDDAGFSLEGDVVTSFWS